MRRRARHWSVRIAMLLGIVLGLWLLGQMRPGEVRVDPRPTAVHGQPDIAPKAVRRPTIRPRAPGLPEAEAPLEPWVDEAVDTAADYVEVVILLEDADGYAVDAGWPYVTGCEIQHNYRTDGGDFAVVVPYGAVCTTWGMRRDGLLIGRSEEVEFEALPGTEVTLVFPVERTGGIGVSFQPVEGGIEVVAVMPGTPAWEAGLAPGDVIVSVEGLSTADLDADAFIAEMTGPEGTDVEFEIEFEADTGLSIQSVQVTRAFLSG